MRPRGVEQGAEAVEESSEGEGFAVWGEKCECRVEVWGEEECEGDVPDGDGSGAGWGGGECATQGLEEVGGPGGGGRCAGTVLVKRVMVSFEK